MSQEPTNLPPNADPRPAPQGLIAQTAQRSEDAGIPKPSSVAPPLPTFRPEALQLQPLIPPSMQQYDLRSEIADYLRNNFSINGVFPSSEGKNLNISLPLPESKTSYPNSVGGPVSTEVVSTPQLQVQVGSPAQTLPTASNTPRLDAMEAERKQPPKTVEQWNHAVHEKSLELRASHPYPHGGDDIPRYPGGHHTYSQASLIGFMSRNKKEGETPEEYYERQEYVKTMRDLGYQDRMEAMKKFLHSKADSWFARGTTYETYKLLIYDATGSYCTLDSKDAALFLHYNTGDEILLSAKSPKLILGTQGGKLSWLSPLDLFVGSGTVDAQASTKNTSAPHTKMDEAGFLASDGGTAWGALKPGYLGLMDKEGYLLDLYPTELTFTKDGDSTTHNAKGIFVNSAGGSATLETGHLNLTTGSKSLDLYSDRLQFTDGGDSATMNAQGFTAISGSDKASMDARGFTAIDSNGDYSSMGPNLIEIRPSGGNLLMKQAVNTGANSSHYYVGSGQNVCTVYSNPTTAHFWASSGDQKLYMETFSDGKSRVKGFSSGTDSFDLSTESNKTSLSLKGGGLGSTIDLNLSPGGSYLQINSSLAFTRVEDGYIHLRGSGDAMDFDATIDVNGYTVKRGATEYSTLGPKLLEITDSTGKVSVPVPGEDATWQTVTVCDNGVMKTMKVLGTTPK